MKSALIAVAVLPALASGLGAAITDQSSYVGTPQNEHVAVAGNLTPPRYGESGFLRTSYLRTSGIGIITEMEERPDGTLTLIGKAGAASFGADLAPGKRTSFEPCRGDVVTAGIGKGMYLCRPSSWTSGPSLISHEGNSLWTYFDHTGSFGAATDDAAAGELGTKRTPGIAVGMNGNGGLRLLTPDGKEAWAMPGANIWHVEIMPASEALGNGIVHSDAEGTITVRDENGNIVQRHTAEIYVGQFARTAWGESPLRDKILAAAHQSVYVLSLNGKTVAKLSAPDILEHAAPAVQGTPVRLTSDGTDYAVIVRHPSGNHTQLHVYDKANKMVYDEALNQDCGALAVHKKQDGTEDLLLGCENAVLKYSLPGGTATVARK